MSGLAKLPWVPIFVISALALLIVVSAIAFYVIEESKRSAFMNQMRGVLIPEFQPPEKETCEDVSAYYQVEGHRCTSLNWSKDGIWLQLSDTVLCYRGGCDSREYLLVRGDFESVENPGQLVLLKPGQNFDKVGKTFCLNNPERKAILFRNGDILVYLFNDTAIFVGLANSADDCDLPFRDSQYLDELTPDSFAREYLET